MHYEMAGTDDGRKLDVGSRTDDGKEVGRHDGGRTVEVGWLTDVRKDGMPKVASQNHRITQNRSNLANITKLNTLPCFRRNNLNFSRERLRHSLELVNFLLIKSL